MIHPETNNPQTPIHTNPQSPTVKVKAAQLNMLEEHGYMPEERGFMLEERCYIEPVLKEATMFAT
jgi:hypothetical protein